MLIGEMVIVLYQLQLGGCWQIGPQLSAEDSRPSGLSGQRFAVDQTSRFVRQTQVNQQPAG